MLKFDVTKRIKDLCNAYSWTYYRLAKESDITYSTLSAMLNKGTIPSIPTLERYVKALIFLYRNFCRGRISSPNDFSAKRVFGPVGDFNTGKPNVRRQIY